MKGWIELIARIITCLIIVWIPFSIVKTIKELIQNKRNRNTEQTTTAEEEYIDSTNKECTGIKTEYQKAYEPKYLMTLNEKSQFKKLEHWAQERKFIVFSKVRLLDLITPRKDQDNYKGLLWKIQAKHVDFVICDQNIKVKCVVEISDNSHHRSDRQERDKFVVEVLQACGYKVLQTYSITEDQLNQICDCTQ